jgi:hypothetical protein
MGGNSKRLEMNRPFTLAMWNVNGIKCTFGGKNVYKFNDLSEVFRVNVIGRKYFHV